MHINGKSIKTIKLQSRSQRMNNFDWRLAAYCFLEDLLITKRIQISLSLDNDPDASNDLGFFHPDQLLVCPSCCGSERWDTAGSEDEDQAVSQQHHPHLPRLFLPLPRLPVSTHPAGAGLHIYRRYTFFFVIQ